MIWKIISLFKAFIYKVIFRQNIQFGFGIVLEGNSKIKIRRGRITFGSNFFSKTGSYFAAVNHGLIEFGNHVYFGRNCMVICQDHISIGDNCSFGPNVLIYDHDHRFSKNGIQPGFHTAPVHIGANCWIGAGVIILKGTCIGEGCVIGAGCVVSGEIPPHSLVKGSRDLEIVPIR